MVGSIAGIVVDGIAYAMFLFIVSVGLSVTMGLMGFINLAHGAFAMAGGYVVLTAMRQFGAPFPAALLATFVIVGLGSIVLERLLYARLYKAGELDQVLFTIGLTFIAVATVTYLFGPAPQPFKLPSYLDGHIDIGLRTVPTYRAFLIVVGLLLVGVLWYGFERTTLGAKIRAAVSNRRMAESVGINVPFLFTLTFGVGSGLAALGGGLSIQLLGLTPSFALVYLVLFLLVVAVGGLGSIKGTLAAALLLGIFDTTGKYLYAEAGGFFMYALAMAVLLIKPAGLYGRE
jgi:branched-chain amino acid transport system permease protein